MAMRIYISGPLKGEKRNREAFEDAARLLEARGYTPLIPHWFSGYQMTDDHFLKRSLETLLKAEGVAIIGTGGATTKQEAIERSLAYDLGMKVFDIGWWLQ